MVIKILQLGIYDYIEGIEFYCSQLIIKNASKINR